MLKHLCFILIMIQCKSLWFYELTNNEDDMSKSKMKNMSVQTLGNYSTDESFEEKKLEEIKNSHERAAEFLEKLESGINQNNEEQTAETILEKLYTEVHEMKDMKGNPNYLDWISSSVQQCINTEKNDENYLKFKIVKFLEDKYNGYYCVDENDKQKHEEHFKSGVIKAYEVSTEELKECLGDLYHDYLEDVI